MFAQKNNFVIKYEKEDNAFIDSLNLKEVYKRVQDFFEFNIILNIKICFLYSVNEFNFFSRDKFEEWKCCFCGSNNTIFIFSPSIIENLTIHKRSEFNQLLTHELSHIFYGNMHFPRLGLFDEGIATYLSFYNRNKNIKNKITITENTLIKEYPKQREIYNLGFKVVNEILEKYNKLKLFEFLKRVQESDSEDKIKESFKEVIGIPITKI